MDQANLRETNANMSLSPPRQGAGTTCRGPEGVSKGGWDRGVPGRAWLSLSQQRGEADTQKWTHVHETRNSLCVQYIWDVPLL